MKRIIISVIILALCTAGAVVELICVKNSVESCIEEINRIDSYMLKDDFTSASKKCEKLCLRWGETLRSADVVLIHDYVDHISINLSQMKAYIDNNSPDMYFACSSATKKELESVRDSEFPLPENIL